MKDKQMNEMLSYLEDKRILKLKISLKGRNRELETIFNNKSYSKSDYANFFMWLYNLNALIYFDDITKNVLYQKEYLTAVIDWKELYNKGVIDKDNKMYIFYTNYPNTYDIFYNKSKYFSMMEYFEYIIPSQNIWTLDNLMFTILTKDGYDDFDIRDIYANLATFYLSLPFAKDDLFTVDKYNIVLKETTGEYMDDSLKQELEEIYNIILSKNLDKKSEHISMDDIDNIENY